MAPTKTSIETRSPIGGWVAVRVLAAILPIVLLVVAVRTTGGTDLFDVEALRAVVQRAGIWGIPLFIAVYAAGILAHVPGSVFVAAGVLAFGPGWGLVWCYSGALIGNLLSFGIVRLTGYRPSFRGAWPVADRLFARLAERPVASVLLIRMVFPTTAPINYALALSNVAFPAYLIGSLLGVLPQLILCVWLLAFALD